MVMPCTFCNRRHHLCAQSISGGEQEGMAWATLPPQDAGGTICYQLCDPHSSALRQPIPTSRPSSFHMAQEMW